MALNKRVNIIDEVRGLLIILVIAYHILFDLAVVFKIRETWAAFRIAHILQPVLPFMFILISGISFQLSRNNIKRGLIIGAAAMALTLVLWIATPDYIIVFGILHLLAVLHIGFGLLKKFIDKIPAPVWIVIIALCVLLFLLTYNVMYEYLGIEGLIKIPLPDSLYQNNFFMPLGFHSSDFVSSDYTPLLPWMFVFIIGIFLGRYARKMPESLIKPHIRPLAFIGRHTLIIYLVHQPIIYAVLWVVLNCC